MVIIIVNIDDSICFNVTCITMKYVAFGMYKI